MLEETPISIRLVLCIFPWVKGALMEQVFPCGLFIKCLRVPAVLHITEFLSGSWTLADLLPPQLTPTLWLLGSPLQ